MGMQGPIWRPKPHELRPCPPALLSRLRPGCRLYPLRFPPPAFTGPPQIFALLIGVDRPETQEGKQSGIPIADAKGFEEVLLATFSVPKENIQVLCGSSATRVGIVDAFARLRVDRRIRPGDAIFIYYSGHSAVSDRAAFILPYDFDERNVTGIPFRNIGRLIENIANAKGNNITLVLDCSYAAIGTGSLDSHVLLAGCGPDEKAREHKITESRGSGNFSLALLEILRSSDAFKLTYTYTIQQIQNKMLNKNQHPQCQGIYQNRYLFSNKSASFHLHYAPILYHPDHRRARQHGGKNVVDAGSAHGLAIGDELLAFRDKISFPNTHLGSTVITTIHDYRAGFQPSGKMPLLSQSSVFIMKTKMYDVKIALPLFQHSLSILSILESSERPFKGITLTTSDEAHLTFVRNEESEELSIRVTDPRLAKYGTTPWFRNGDSIAPKELPDVLENAFDYCREFDRIGPNMEVAQAFEVRFYALQYQHVDGVRSVAPLEPNLYDSHSREVHLDTSDSAHDMYGIAITSNLAQHKFDLYINYFDPHDCSIEMVYGEYPKLSEDTPLGGEDWELTIGYGSTGYPPLVLPKISNESIRVGFFRFYFFPYMDNMTDWATITIPVIQHRVTST